MNKFSCVFVENFASLAVVIYSSRSRKFLLPQISAPLFFMILFLFIILLNSEIVKWGNKAFRGGFALLNKGSFHADLFGKLHHALVFTFR